MKTYVDREVLLQVKRIYSKDEIIADLHRQLKEYGVKVGIMESQIAELEDENKALHINRQDEYVKWRLIGSRFFSKTSFNPTILLLGSPLS